MPAAHLIWSSGVQMTLDMRDAKLQVPPAAYSPSDLCSKRSFKFPVIVISIVTLVTQIKISGKMLHTSYITQNLGHKSTVVHTVLCLPFWKETSKCRYC